REKGIYCIRLFLHYNLSFVKKMALDPKDLAGVAMLRSFLQRSKYKTIEKQQKFLAKAHLPSSSSTLVKKATVPET
ncbi:8217_t:CDS:2, partial [Scutellospora calospora]